ncbi:MAG: hypothetical protein HYV63_12640 [Candidatus Schekmanbacteria bacterium]|nr:hypothetical protein [Candidatus Schekmanbacteria bacterium]
MSDWPAEFRRRMHHFGAVHQPAPGETAVSIKVRVQSGCFHREHSPRAYAIIDRHLDELAPEDLERTSFEEHESGPELLVWLAVATAGLTLAKSIVDLVTAIIKARSEGVKQGDHPSEPLELIVRRVGNRDELREEAILRIGHNEPVAPKEIEAALERALEKLLRDTEEQGS